VGKLTTALCQKCGLWRTSDVFADYPPLPLLREGTAHSLPKQQMPGSLFRPEAEEPFS
jgi:hypothetical protein